MCVWQLPPLCEEEEGQYLASPPPARRCVQVHQGKHLAPSEFAVSSEVAGEYQPDNRVFAPVRRLFCSPVVCTVPVVGQVVLRRAEADETIL